MNNKELSCKDGRKVEPVQNHFGTASVEPPGSATRKFVKLLTSATDMKDIYICINLKNLQW
jgi:hypothetical protein